MSLDGLVLTASTCNLVSIGRCRFVVFNKKEGSADDV